MTRSLTFGVTPTENEVYGDLVKKTDKRKK